MRPGAYVPQNKNQKTKGSRKWARAWFVFVGFSFLGGLFFGTFFEWHYRRTQQELHRLRAENARLSRRIEALQKNPALYEEVARKKYGYVKKNERLIIFEKGR